MRDGYAPGMKISESWTYPAATDRVWAMVSDKAFQDAKCVDAGATAHETSVTPQGEGAVIVASRDMPTDGVPEQLRSLIGKTITVVETQTWSGPAADGSRTATLEVVMKGQPIGMKGTASMKPAGEGTEVTIEGDLKAKIPLIGGRIEKAAAPVVIDSVRAEAGVGRTFLEG